MKKIKRTNGLVLAALLSFASFSAFSLAFSHDNKAQEVKAAIAGSESYWSVIPSSTISTGGQTLFNAIQTRVRKKADNSTNATVISYDGLWSAYQKTDLVPGTTNKIWDMYGGFQFIYGTDQAGNYSGEGDKYNREHSVPKSWFNEASPMYSDLVHLVPTDGYVNGRRSNYAFGETNGETYSYSFPARNDGNGKQIQTAGTSKLGTPKAINGATTTESKVFEPDDQYKGDFARIYYYFITRYAGQATISGSGTAIFSTSYPYLTNYGLALLKKWHEQDPVSQKEIDRNNAIEECQGNRNPYVDHPEWTNKMFGTSYNVDVEDPTGITISDSTREMTVNSTHTFTSYVSPSNALQSVTWSSSDTSIIEFTSASTGAARAKAEGSAVLTVTCDANTALTASITVTVSSSGSGGGGDSGETTFTLVTANSSLSNGDKVVVKTAAGIGVTGNGSGNAAVSSTESEWKQFVVGSATSSGFTLYDSTASQYIASPNGNTFGYSTTAGTCSVDSDGHLICNNRYLCKNGTYYRFYTSVGSFLPFFVYLVNDGGSSSPTVSSIQITNAPTKLTYTAGECFDPTGLLIKATYSDNSKVTVEYALHSSDFTFTPSLTTPLTTSNTSVSISYGGANASQPITVNAAPTLSSISLSGTYPTVFTVGDTFSHEGMVVTANYTNPTSSSVVTNSASWSSPDMSSAGVKTVTVTYSTASTTYQITVNEAETPISEDYTGTSVTSTMSANGYSNQQQVSSITMYTDSQNSSQKIIVTFNKGTNTNNPPKYYTTGSSIRAYGGNTITVTSSLKNLVGVVFTFASGGDNNEITSNRGTYSNGTWTGGIGGDHDSVTFTIGGTSGHRRIASITVKYFGLNDYPSSFLSNITCDNGVTRPNTSKWSTMSTNYGYLFAADKKTMKDTSANQSGTTIQKAVARYDYIVGKYNKGQGLTSYNDFMDRDPATISGSGVFNMNIENNSSIPIMIVCTLSLFTLSAAFIYKKKRK